VGRPKSAQGAADLGGTEAPGEHLDTISEHHWNPIAEAIGEAGPVDVDRLEGVPSAPSHGFDDGLRLGAQHARAAGQEDQVAHCGSVSSVRPGTTVAILLLLALLLIAGVIFVVRLNAVT
jgi:hypothetical protein